MCVRTGCAIGHGIAYPSRIQEQDQHIRIHSSLISGGTAVLGSKPVPVEIPWENTTFLYLPIFVKWDDAETWGRSQHSGTSIGRTQSGAHTWPSHNINWPNRLFSERTRLFLGVRRALAIRQHSANASTSFHVGDKDQDTSSLPWGQCRVHLRGDCRRQHHCDG